MTKIKMTVPVTMTVDREVWVEFDYTPEESETSLEPGCEAAYEILSVHDTSTGDRYISEVNDDDIIQRLEELRV